MRSLEDGVGNFISTEMAYYGMILWKTLSKLFSFFCVFCATSSLPVTRGGDHPSNNYHFEEFLSNFIGLMVSIFICEAVCLGLGILGAGGVGRGESLLYPATWILKSFSSSF